MASLPEIVARLVASGASQADAAMGVMEAFELGRMSGTSPGHVPDIPSIIRAYEANKKAISRAKSKENQGAAKANDVARALENVPDKSKDHCDLSSSITSSFEGTSEKKKEKKEVIARARGTRIPEDWQPRDEDREFARSLGLDPDKLRDEFVDYWIAIPGSRGAKLNWFSTYRNRAREVAGRRNAYGQRSGQTRTNPSGPAQTNTDVILAGVARSAERRFGSQSPGSGGPLSGRSDSAGGDDAVGKPAGRDPEAFGGLRIVASANS